MSNILKRIPIRIRISIGLVGLMTGTILLASAIGFLPNSQTELLRGRAKLCEAMAISGTAMASSRNPEALDLMMESIVNRDTEVLSIGMRLSSGDLLTFSGPHAEHWDSTSADSTVQMSVPIYRFGKPYAEMEVAFASAFGSGWKETKQYLIDEICSVIAFARRPANAADMLEPTRIH